jgi:hypothetical protein
MAILKDYDGVAPVSRGKMPSNFCASPWQLWRRAPLQLVMVAASDYNPMIGEPGGLET